MALKRLARNPCFAVREGATRGILQEPSWPGWGLGLGLPVGSDLVTVAPGWFRASVGLAKVLYNEGGSWVCLGFTQAL